MSRQPAGRRGHSGWPAIAAAVLSLLLPTGVGADVTLSAPQASRQLQRELAGASLLLQVNREGQTSAQDLFVAARADYARFLSVLYAEGYYGGSIHILLDGREAADFAAVDAPDRVGSVRISVDPGPRFRFGKARMKPYAPGTRLPPAYRDGQPALSTAISDAAQAGVEGWRQLGYAKATVDGQTITADHRTQLLDAEVHLRAGPQLHFGTLHVTGAERMRPTPIRKIAGYPEGQLFDPDVLAKMATRLRRAGVFRSVVIREAPQPGRDGRLDITLALEEEAPRRLGFGAEYSSLDGASLSAFWLHRNLFGGAERLRFDLLAKGIGAKTNLSDYKLGVRLERPATPFTDSSAFVTAGAERQKVGTATTRSLSFGIGAERVISPTLTADLGLTYLDQSFDDQGFHASYRLLSLPISLKWDRRSDPLAPVSGSYLVLGATPFRGFGTTESGTQFKADARIYRPIGAENRVVLAGRLQLGTVTTASLLNTAPDFLFFSGGGGTVRGHPFQSLGVATPVGSGQVVQTGGRSFIGLSGEVRATVNERLGAAAFYDAGYVSAGSWFGGGGAWQAGAGVGVRYDTGFGPVRLDLAVPVGGGTGRGLQVYVGIGQAF